MIELVMVIAIVGILAAAGSSAMIYLTQNMSYIPNQLNMDMTAQDALNIMAEGDSQAKGMRFAKSVTSKGNNQVIFNNQDGHSIEYRLDTGQGKLYRSIDGGSESLMPYYQGAGITIEGVGGNIFTYYDAAEAEANNAANVRRIEIALACRTGTGSFDEWEGRAQQLTSITVKKME